MGRRLIIDDATGALYEDFTARRVVSVADILTAEGGATETVEVFLVSVNPQTRAVATTAIATANVSLDIGSLSTSPTGGKVIVSYGGESTGELPVATLNADTLGMALNRLDAVESDGGVDVWSAGDPGELSFYVRLQNTGSPGTNPSVDCDGSTPPSAAEVTVITAGSSSERALWLVQIAEKPVASIAESAWSTATSGSFGGLTASLALNGVGLLAHLAKKDPDPLTLTVKNSGSVILRGNIPVFPSVDPTDLNGSAILSIFPRIVTSTSNPTVNDDSGDGYAVGTLWINTSSPAAYILISNASGAANWDLLSEGTNLTASRAVVSDSSGLITASDVTSTELGYLDGVTSAIQTQLNAKQAQPSEGAFANGDKTKLDGIEASADVTDATNVTAAGALMDSELTDLAGVKGVTISTLQVKPSEGAFANGDKTKLDGIEASADVTDATNVSAAGALMKSGGTMTGSLTLGGAMDANYSQINNLSDASSNQDAVTLTQLNSNLLTAKNDQTGTTYTLVAGDARKTVRLNNASTVTLTVPKSVFSAGDVITLFRKGAGGVTISPVDSDVTINSVGTKRKLASQYSAATLICVTGGATPEFDLIGDLTA